MRVHQRRKTAIAVLATSISLMVGAQVLAPSSALAVNDDGSVDCLYSWSSIDCVAAAEESDPGLAGDDTWSWGDDSSSDDDSSWGDDGSPDGDIPSYDDASEDNSSWGEDSPDDTSVDVTTASYPVAQPQPVPVVVPETEPLKVNGEYIMPGFTDPLDDSVRDIELFTDPELDENIPARDCNMQNLTSCRGLAGVRLARPGHKDDQPTDHWDFGKKKSRKGHSRVRATAKHTTRKRAARGSGRLG